MQTVQASKRIGYIDIAKGIGILLVVLGHNEIFLVSRQLYRFIYSFHMPLFFFLSGYFFRTTYTFWEVFRKRFNSLLKPFLFTIFIIYAAGLSFTNLGFSKAIERITESMYGNGFYLDWVQLWFLPHLFLDNLFAFFFYWISGKIFKNRYVRWAVLIVMLAIAVPNINRFLSFNIMISGKDVTIYGLPYSLDLVFVSGFFFVMGNEFRHYVPEKVFENVPLLIGSGSILILLTAVFTQRIDFNGRIYDSFLINTPEAILGILFTLTVSKQLEMRTDKLASLFKYLGNATLFILIFHVPIQDYWGRKIMGVTNNQTFSIIMAFFCGVIGSVTIYQLFIKDNQIALWWFGRTNKKPEPQTADQLDSSSR